MITSFVSMKYLADCEPIANVKMLYFIIWTIYLCLFVSLGIYNLAKFSNGFHGLVNKALCIVQVKLLVLILFATV